MNTWKRYLTLLALLILPCMASQAATFEMPAAGDDLVGKSFTVRANKGDSLEQIGKYYDIGFHEMKEANPQINTRHIRAGSRVTIPYVFVLPQYREGIVINIAELRLYYFTPDGKQVITFPVGLGRRNWRTPTADTVVTRKQKNPTWHVPKSIREFVYAETGKWLPDYIRPGPENPLGRRAIYLAKQGYLIHGTNQPWTIGKLVSAGCIRMFNEDVEDLYPLVETGTKVRIIHHPYKVGWSNGVLYIEAHEPVALDDPINHLNILDADKVVQVALKGRHADVDWSHVDYAVRQNRGIPYAVGNYHPYAKTR